MRKILTISMLDYLISLLDDANDFSWDAAKASHAVLICWMEQGEVKDYTQTDKIDRIRRANPQRHLPYTNNFQQHSAAKNPMSRLQKVCHASSLIKAPTSVRKPETRGTLYKHICSSCFATGGKQFSHPEIECRKKHKKHTKNE